MRILSVILLISSFNAFAQTRVKENIKQQIMEPQDVSSASNVTSAEEPPQDPKDSKGKKK